jgi:hypothetical protein
MGMFGGVLEVVRVMNLPCKEHSMLISRDADGQVRRATHLGLRLHYIICSPCRHFAAQLHFLRKAAARLAPSQVQRALTAARMPQDVRQRIASRLRG